MEYVAAREKENSPSHILDNADATTIAEIEADRTAGFTSNALIRKAVEERAIAVMREAFPEVTLQDTSTTKPYDFARLEDTKERYIEVKGPNSRAQPSS